VADQVLIQRGAKHYRGKLRVQIEAFRPDNRRRDLDNLVKATSDLLVTHGVIEDDSKIWKLTSLWSRQITGLVVNVESFNEQGVKAA
jgi:Holliday junction resolvase RusA-like endonuclease